MTHELTMFGVSGERRHRDIGILYCLFNTARVLVVVASLRHEHAASRGTILYQVYCILDHCLDRDGMAPNVSETPSSIKEAFFTPNNSRIRDNM